MPKTCQKPYAKTPQKPAKNPLKIPQPKIWQKSGKNLTKILYGRLPYKKHLTFS